MNYSVQRPAAAQAADKWSIAKLDQLCETLEMHKFSMRCGYVLIDQDLRLTEFRSKNFNTFIGEPETSQITNCLATHVFPEIVGIEVELANLKDVDGCQISLQHIVHEHAELGVVYMNYRFQPAGCSDDEGLTLLVIEQVLGIAEIETELTRKLHQAEERISDLNVKAHRDSLTQVSNRRALFEQLRIEVERAHRYKHPLSVMLIDLDNFKLINDTKGHQVGDNLLRDFALQVKSSIRASDMVARYGGDEFVVVQPSATEADAVTLAKRLQDIAIGLNMGISLSIGIVICPTHAGTDMELLRLADKAMYISKRVKNEITVYSDDIGQLDTMLLPQRDTTIQTS